MTILASRTRQRLRYFAYLAGFCLAFANALGAYLNSSFIQQFLGTARVGWIYTGTSLVMLIASWLTLPLIRRHGNRDTIILFGLGSILGLGWIILTTGQALSLVGLAVFMVAGYLAAINLDVYLETLSDDRTTGTTRGFFLTAVNLAWLASPWLSSNLTQAWGYRAVYTSALAMMLPFLSIVVFGLRDVSSGRTAKLSLRSALLRLADKKEEDLRRILSLDLLLNLFYSIMIVYMPLHLHENIGLSWPEIGLVFTIMLLPFVLLDLPLGHLADHYYGEKELLIFGLLAMILACAFVPLITTPAILLWAALLLFSRIGAATLEVMKETYLFKYIDGNEVNIVYLSRSMYPLAYLIGPLIASIFLHYLPLNLLFILLAVILCIGLPAAMRLRDTK